MCHQDYILHLIMLLGGLRTNIQDRWEIGIQRWLEETLKRSVTVNLAVGSVICQSLLLCQT